MTTGAHEMVRQAVDQSGTQEWLCPACGRHLLLTFPPNYRKIVLSRGDMWTPHVGATASLNVSAVGVAPPERQWTDDDERALRAWAQRSDPDEFL